LAKPKKLYYSISEVCSETDLEQHVLRYWEMEFFQLRPKKNRAGNRAYRFKDIKLVKFIKHILYDEHYTIQGAKKKLLEAKDFDISHQKHMNLGEKREALLGIKKELGLLLYDMKQWQKTA